MHTNRSSSKSGKTIVFIFNLLRMVRKWRILNVIVILVLFTLLMNRLNGFSKPSPSLRILREPIPIPRPKLSDVKENLDGMNEVEQNLMTEVREFLTRKKSRIPKIIHQIYRNSSIPLVYKEFIESWMEKNPDYEYWFWDDASGRHFIQMFYPEFLELYDAYCHDLFRSDALRYFVLNEFGGIYIDMDYLCLKPIDDLLEERYLHVVQEHEPQAQLLYNTDDMILNAFMATVPYHPFMNFLINNLASHVECKFDAILKSTGPLFVYEQMMKYRDITKCNGDLCDVHVLPYTLMMPEWDMSIRSRRHQMRTCRRMIRLTPTQRKACIFFRQHQFSPPQHLSKDAYATHKFLHIGNEARKYKDRKGYLDIKRIVPNVVFPMVKLFNETKFSDSNNFTVGIKE